MYPASNTAADLRPPSSSGYPSPLGGTFYPSAFDVPPAQGVPHLGGRLNSRLQYSPQDPYGYGFPPPPPRVTQSPFIEPHFPEAQRIIPYEAIPIREPPRSFGLETPPPVVHAAPTLPPSAAHGTASRRWLMWGAIGLAAAGVVYCCFGGRLRSVLRRSPPGQRPQKLNTTAVRGEEGEDGGEDPHGEISTGASADDGWEVVTPGAKVPKQRPPPASSDTTFHFPEPTEAAFVHDPNDYDDLGDDLSSLGGASAGASLTSAQGVL